MVLTLQHVRTQKELDSFGAGVWYVGSTTDPQRRRGEHERDDGYYGIMYYAHTKNMMLAEDKLLEFYPDSENIQRYSNARSKPGYVYIIVSILTLKRVTQEVLWSVAPRGQYAGFTNDPERRRGELKREGYNGTMYYAYTENMELVEETLLEVCSAYRNRQRHSNTSPDPGYVYIIV